MKKKRPEGKNKKKASIADKIVDLTELEEPLIVELYGRSGTGKTRTLSTFPKPMLIIDVKEKGSVSAKSKNLKKGEISILPVSDLDEVYDIYDYIKENTKKYKTVAIDTTTALEALAKEKVKEEEGKAQMSQRMFGFAADYMKEIVLMFKELSDVGIIPVFTCQDKLESGDGDGEDQLMPEVGPSLMPSVTKFLNAACTVIGHTYIQEKTDRKTSSTGIKVEKSIEYRLRLGPNPYYITKMRKPQEAYCPPYLVNATYDEILAISRGEYKSPVKEEPRRKKPKK